MNCLSPRQLVAAATCLALIASTFLVWQWGYAAIFLAAWFVGAANFRYRARLWQRAADGLLGAAVGALLIHVIVLVALGLAAIGRTERSGLAAEEVAALLTPRHEVPSAGTDFDYAQYASRDDRREFVRCRISPPAATQFLKRRAQVATAGGPLALVDSPRPLRLDETPRWWPALDSAPDLHLRFQGEFAQHSFGECWWYLADQEKLLGCFYAGD